MQYTHMTFELLLLLAKYTNNLQLCGKFSMCSMWKCQIIQLVLHNYSK